MNKLKNTVIISGFPAVGKSVLTKNSQLVVLDSDSIEYSWISEGVRHPDFPNNYIKHIQENIGKADYILVSSHDIVRKALENNEIKYFLVYPDIDLKDEYLERYKHRGNDEKFISFIDSNWDKFILDIEREKFPTLVKLNKGQFLSDVINDLNNKKQILLDECTAYSMYGQSVYPSRVKDMINKAFKEGCKQGLMKEYLYKTEIEELKRINRKLNIMIGRYSSKLDEITKHLQSLSKEMFNAEITKELVCCECNSKIDTSKMYGNNDPYYYCNECMNTDY